MKLVQHFRKHLDIAELFANLPPFFSFIGLIFYKNSLNFSEQRDIFKKYFNGIVEYQNPKKFTGWQL